MLDLLNQLVIVVIVGFILVGGIAAFSIYLQQDDAIATVERVMNPNLHCLDKWNYLQDQYDKDRNYKLIEANQKIFSEFLSSDCNNSFRTWMDESHPDWSDFIAGENNRIDTCKRYLAGEGTYTDFDIENLKLWECEDFLKTSMDLKKQESNMPILYKINTECEYIHFINEPESMPKLLDFISSNPELYQQKYFALGGPMTDDRASIVEKDRVFSLVIADIMLEIFPINPSLEDFIIEIQDESNTQKLVERIKNTDPECELPEFVGLQRFAEPPTKSITLELEDISVEKISEESATIKIAFKISNPNPGGVTVQAIDYQLYATEYSSSEQIAGGEIGSRPTGMVEFGSNYYVLLGGNSILLRDTITLKGSENTPELWSILKNNNPSWKVSGDVFYNSSSTTSGQENKLHFEFTK